MNTPVHVNATVDNHNLRQFVEEIIAEKAAGGTEALRTMIWYELSLHTHMDANTLTEFITFLTQDRSTMDRFLAYKAAKRMTA